MKKTFFLIVVVALLAVAGALYFLPPKDKVENTQNTDTATPTTTTPSTNQTNNDNNPPLPDSPEILVSNIKDNDVIKSPLHIEGQVLGTWMFEASFPVTILDANKKTVARGPAMTSDNWMTTDFVNFSIDLSFKKPATPTGFILFENDNPSGLPENAKAYMMPIRFE